MLSSEQRAFRKTGLTATDMVAVMGLDPRRTPFDVAASKLLPDDAPETVSAKPPEEGDPAALGVELEPWLRAQYAIRHGCGIVGANVTIRHRTHEIALATPDGIVVEPPSPEWQRILECKTANFVPGRRRLWEWGEGGSDHIPRQYLVQVHWQMFVAGLPEADVAALIGGMGYREYRIAADPSLHEFLWEAAEKFWTDYVKARKLPADPGPSERATAELGRLFRSHTDELLEVMPGSSVMPTVEELYRAAHARKAEEEAYDAAGNRARLLIAEAKGLKGPWGKLYWTRSKDSTRTDWEAVAKELAEKVAQVDFNLAQEHHSAVREGGRSLRAYWDENWWQEEAEGGNA